MNENVSPSSAYYEPPSFHEVCKCEECHEVGEHEDSVEQWAKWGCGGCEDIIRLNSLH